MVNDGRNFEDLYKTTSNIMKISKPAVITPRLLPPWIAIYANSIRQLIMQSDLSLPILSGRVYVFRYAARLSIYPKDMVTKYNHINWLVHAKITLCL